MIVIGKESEIDKELVENNLDYDEEIWSGLIHSNECDITNGCFFEDDTNKWMIIRNGRCPGSLENCYNSLEMMLDLESIWGKLKFAMETDSLNCQSTSNKGGDQSSIFCLLLLWLYC